MATPPSLKSVSDQLADLQETVQSLTVRVSGYAKHSSKLQREVSELTEQHNILWKNWNELKARYDEHCLSDGKWWRQSLDSIMSDIDDLRSDGRDTTPSSTRSGPTVSG